MNDERRFELVKHLAAHGFSLATSTPMVVDGVVGTYTTVIPAVTVVGYADAILTAFAPEPEAETGPERDPEWVEGYAISLFMRGSLIALAGAVCTPEEGYLVDGGFRQLLSDIQTLRKAHDRLATELAAAQARVEELEEAAREVDAGFGFITHLSSNELASCSARSARRLRTALAAGPAEGE